MIYSGCTPEVHDVEPNGCEGQSPPCEDIKAESRDVGVTPNTEEPPGGAQSGDADHVVNMNDGGQARLPTDAEPVGASRDAGATSPPNPPRPDHRDMSPMNPSTVDMGVAEPAEPDPCDAPREPGRVPAHRLNRVEYST